jgi:hypothetical protein
LAKNAKVPSMNSHVALLLGLFVFAMLLPFIPGIRELRRPRDTLSLPVDDGYIRNPRHFARALRNRLAPQVATAKGEGEISLRRHERITIYDLLVVPPGATAPDLLVVRHDLDAAAGASIREAWVQGDAYVGAGVRMRGLACDRSLRLGPKCSVDRWVDSEHDTHVEPGCDLGMSATAGGVLRISPGCTFRRLWGQPIRTLGGRLSDSEPEPRRTIEHDVVWARDRLSVPPGALVDAGIVAYGRLVIGRGAVVRGTVKAYGELVIDDAARIEGDVIGRSSVRLGKGSRVDGNVFTERDVYVGADVSVGREGAFKTVFAARHVTLGPHVSIYGWVVAELGGKVEAI